jgi:hypothetical protein
MLFVILVAIPLRHELMHNAVVSSIVFFESDTGEICTVLEDGLYSNLIRQADGIYIRRSGILDRKYSTVRATKVEQNTVVCQEIPPFTNTVYIHDSVASSIFCTRIYHLGGISGIM